MNIYSMKEQRCSSSKLIGEGLDITSKDFIQILYMLPWKGDHSGN